MVRLKCRYVLGEIVFADGQTQTNYNVSTVLQYIKDGILSFFGEAALASCSQILQGILSIQ